MKRLSAVIVIGVLLPNFVAAMEIIIPNQNGNAEQGCLKSVEKPLERERIQHPLKPTKTELFSVSIEAVKKALSDKIGRQSLQARNPLHVAALQSDVERARLFLHNGTALNAQDIDGATPLHLAISKGNIEMTKLLLERGASPHILNSNGFCPTQEAASRKHFEIVRLLVASSSPENKNGGTPTTDSQSVSASLAAVQHKTILGRSSVTSMCFTVDNALITLDLEDEISIRHAIGEEKKIIYQAEKYKTAVSFDSIQKKLYCQSNNTFVAWSLSDFSQSFTVHYPLQERVKAIAVSTNEEAIAIAEFCGAPKADIKVRYKSSSKEQRLSGHTDTVTALAFIPNSIYLVSSSQDKTARLWNVTTKSCVQIFRGHTNGITCLAIGPAGKTIVTGSLDCTMRLFNTDGSCIRAFIGHTGPIKCVSFSPDGRILASGSNDSTVKLWDVETGTCIVTLTGPKERILTVCFSNDSKMLAASSADKTITLWNLTPKHINGQYINGVAEKKGTPETTQNEKASSDPISNTQGQMNGHGSLETYASIKEETNTFLTKLFGGTANSRDSQFLLEDISSWKAFVESHAAYREWLESAECYDKLINEFLHFYCSSDQDIPAFLLWLTYSLGTASAKNYMHTYLQLHPKEKVFIEQKAFAEILRFAVTPFLKYMEELEIAFSGKNSDDTSWLMAAIKRGNIIAVKYFLEEHDRLGIDINDVDSSGMSGFCYALSENDYILALLILNHPKMVLKNSDICFLKRLQLL